MLTLTLLRHAKSSWADSRLDDFDRPLAPRGQKAAPKIARAMREFGPDVDRVLCSTAVRTRQTLDLVLPDIGAAAAEVQFDDRLYHALPDDLLDAIHHGAGSARHVLLIGHNPGLEVLALRLTKDGPRDAIQAMTAKFPTAAAAQFQFETMDWANLAFGTGQLVYFLTPRTLS